MLFDKYPFFINALKAKMNKIIITLNQSNMNISFVIAFF